MRVAERRDTRVKIPPSEDRVHDPGILKHDGVIFQGDDNWDDKGISVGVERDLVRQYLKDIHNEVLLTKEEEVTLAQQIDRGREAGQELVRGNSQDGRLDKLREEVARAQEARDHFTKANTRLVISIAKKFMGKDIPFIDLIQDGNLGLMKAIEKFDHTKGFRFSTYATRLIRQAITRAIDNTARTIRVPVSMHEQVRRLSWAIRQFKQEWGRNPSIEEISQFTGQNFKGVELILRAATIPLSLNEPVGEDDDTELGDFIEDKSALEPSDIVAKRMMREEIEKHLETLNHREARILRLRFGLDGGPALTLEQVGQKFSLTRERIRQIEDKALRRLRHPRRSRKLRAYYES